MSSTLIDSVKAIFTEDFNNKLAALLGETEADTKKAVHAAVPTVLTGLLQKVEAPDGPATVHNLARQAAGSDLHGHIHELNIGTGGLAVGHAMSTKGQDFLRSILGSRVQQTTDAVVRYGSVKASSASFVLGLASFASLDTIGRHISNTNLDAPGLRPWLATQRDSIIQAIPAGLNVKEALGLKHLPGEKASAGARRSSLVYGIIAVIILIGILFFVFKTCNKPSPTSPVADTTATSNNLPPADTTATAPNIKVTLPDGTVLDAYKGGTEDQLVSFLSDPNAKLDKKNGNWFDFSKIGFASNSAELLLESEGQLKNIVAILKAFPKAKIKIGGYSDNTGDSTENVRLSQQRADNILAKLKSLGAPSHQLTGAEGYGPQYPIGDNGTAEGRKMNRRMSLDVKDK